MKTDTTTNVIALTIIALAMIALAGTLKALGIADTGQLIGTLVGALSALGAVFGFARAGTRPKLVLLFGLAGLAAFAATGCSQAREDRGTLSGQPSAVKLTIAGHSYEGTQTAPTIETDENGFHRPDVDAVVTEIDGQISALRESLAAAREAGDAEQVARIEDQLASLRLAKTAARASGMTIVNVYDSGNVSITGEAETTSPGDTTQTPTTEANPEVDVGELPGG